MNNSICFSPGQGRQNMENRIKPLTLKGRKKALDFYHSHNLGIISDRLIFNVTIIAKVWPESYIPSNASIST